MGNSIADSEQIAVVSTIPWDSYLIRRKVWTYPADAIIGPTIFSIPLEELFFFIIQTYNTTLLYLLLSKPTFHPYYLVGAKEKAKLSSDLTRAEELERISWSGSVLLVSAISIGTVLIIGDGQGVYLGLILVWACPFLLLLWVLAHQLLINLPTSNVIWPIAIPTLYLWIVDTLALRRGTWSIESGTKLDIQLWPHLEIEEAIFFLLTNVLVVFGLVAFDNAVAILELFPTLVESVPTLPSPAMLVKALLTPLSLYDEARIEGLRDAVHRLQNKSRSFYFASSAFSGRLRIDLILLYSFCRVADDLVDNAPSAIESQQWISRLEQFLDSAYPSHVDKDRNRRLEDLEILKVFPVEYRSSLALLPSHIISQAPLRALLDGFETDVEFGNKKWPIESEGDLDDYAYRVAGTIARMCLELVFHHTTQQVATRTQERLVAAGGTMGKALQYVNIARDIGVDASMGRVYIPSDWLEEYDLCPEDIIQNPNDERIEILRVRLLSKASIFYKESRPAINELPPEASGAMKVAVECYMEIGRVLKERNFKVKRGRATVPIWRKLKVGWVALNE
jgi:15-cis-phytoene synthase / lycopene beta-cyclase